MKKTDALIIGFGKGGKTLAGALAKAGKEVVVVERDATRYGGTCINVACIPTKSLVKNAALSAAIGGGFKDRETRYASAIEEKDRLVAKLRDKNYHKLADNPKITVIDGEASFLEAHRILVKSVDGGDDVVFEANQVFVDTGAVARTPNTPGLMDSSRSYISETMLDLKELPHRLCVVGGGYIGLEFASMYANFGSQVTIIQHGPTFLPREDREIADAVLGSLEARGIRVMFSTKVEKVEDDENYTAIRLATPDGTDEIAADAILVATGRKPNTEGLNLEAAGIETTERGGIKCDEHLRTTAEGVWAMGDVVGGLQFTYISLDDYRIVASDVLGDGSRTIQNRGAVPYSVFIDPPFSRAGLSEDEAKEKGLAFHAVKMPAAVIPKAQLLGKPTGLLKALVDDTSGKVVGAHLFCEESYELINLLKVAMDAGLSYKALRDSIYTHPTMSEAFNDLFAMI